VKRFLADRKVPVCHHPPYSPNSNSADSFLFPKPRFSLRGQHFQSIMEIQGAKARELNSIQTEAFLEGIKKVA
jgi:hypothetical protein